MYRVYDKKSECWVRENVYISFNKDLLIGKKHLFNTLKLSRSSSDKYIIQESIGLEDANKRFIYEGDIAKVEVTDEVNNTTFIVTGVISYYTDHACYYLFDYQNNKYYPLSKKICEKMEIIGNVIENSNLLPS